MLARKHAASCNILMRSQLLISIDARAAQLVGEAVATDTNLRVTDMHFRMNSMSLAPRVASENRYNGDV